MLIEYIASARSINELQNSLKMQGISLSRYHLDRLMQTIGTIAQTILKYFDAHVAPLIHVIETDETFHGDTAMFFEAVDHRTGYILDLKMIPDAASHTLIPHYEALFHRFPQISTIITDLAPAYPKICDHLRKRYNNDLCHIKCQVHALRTIYKKLEAVKRKYTECLSLIRTLKHRLKTLQTKRTKAKKSKSYYDLAYQNKIIQRARLQASYNVKKYSKHLWSRYPELKVLNDRLNRIRSMIRGKQSSIVSYDSKIMQCKKALVSAKQEMRKYWNGYMSHLKMKCLFVSYCKHRISSLQEFRKRLHGFKHKRCREFKTSLLHFVHSHPELMSLHRYLEEGESFIALVSTNKIESFNNVLRRYKDARRYWKDTALTTAYLSILRLYMNIRRPFCSKGAGCSPVEKCGIDLKGRTLYDLLFNRLDVGVFDVAVSDFELGLIGGGSLVVWS